MTSKRQPTVIVAVVKLKATYIFVDNKLVLALAKNPISHNRGYQIDTSI